MSSEVRLVRPFVGADRFQKILDHSSLRSLDRSIEGGGEVSVSLDEYLNYPFTLSFGDADWSQASTGAAELGLDPADIDLLVLAAAPRLRFVDTVFRMDLGDLANMPEEVEIGAAERPRALRAPHGGTDLRIYLCLNRSLEPRPLSPWRRGSWLASQEYRVRSDLSGTGFVPIRMTDDDREQLGVPDEVARFATLEDGDPFDREPPSDIVKLYVDGELLDRLAVAASTPVGKHIQRQLFVDATSAIVFAAQGRLAEEPTLGSQHVDDFAGSLVHKLTEVIAGKATDSLTCEQRQVEFRRLCDQPTSFIAQIEAKTGMRRDMLDSFGDVR